MSDDFDPVEVNVAPIGTARIIIGVVVVIVVLVLLGAMFSSLFP